MPMLLPSVVMVRRSFSPAQPCLGVERVGSAVVPKGKGVFKENASGKSCAVGQPCGDAYVSQLNATDGTVQLGVFLGGTGDDRGYALALDASGNIYVVGQTNSPANGNTAMFPSSGVAYPPNTPNTSRPMRANQGGIDGFLLSITPTMTAYRFGAYYGGSNDDYSTGVAVSADGAATYITGYTASTASTFPISSALPNQATYHGGTFDAFVAKLSTATPSSPTIAWSTYLGNAGEDRAENLTIDSTGNAYVVGWTGSSSFPTTTGAYQTAKNGGTDAFVSKITAAGTALSFSTLLGGLNDERGYGITLDATNAPIITGWTATPDTATPPFPRVNALSGTYNGSVFGGVKDVFVSRLRADGATLLLSTYVGGAGSDVGQGVALDSQQMAYVTGSAGAPGSGGTPFPTTATSPVRGSGNDAFLAKFDVGVLSGATLSLSRNSPASGINSLNTPQSLVARLTVNNVALIGFPVTFSVNGVNAPGSTACANPPNSTTTDSNGNISFCYVGANIGTDTIQASATNGFGTTVTSPSVSVSWTKLNGAHLTLSPLNLGPYSINSATAPITATLTDNSTPANAIQNVVIHFTVNGVNTTGSNPDPTTNAAGQATYTYTGGSSAGTDTVCATATDGTSSITAPTCVSVTWSQGLGKLMLILLNTTPSPINTTQSVKALYTDVQGHPINNTPIQFSINGPNGPCASGCTLATDSNGYATYSYSGSAAGADSVQASAGTATAQAVSNAVSVEWTTLNNPILNLSTSNATPSINSTEALTATLTQAAGTAIQNIPVHFTITGVNPQSGTALTNGSGQATFTYIGTYAGADTAQASVTDGVKTATSPSKTITWGITGSGAHLTLGPDTVGPNRLNTTQVERATLLDANNTPLVGVSVQFSVNGANGTKTGTTTTDPSGVATYSYTGTVTGDDTILATASPGGVQVQSSTVNVKWAALQDATLILSPDTAGPISLNTEQTLTATLKDHKGVGIPNITVSFAFTCNSANVAEAAQCSPSDDASSAPIVFQKVGEVTTDNQGIAQYKYTGRRGQADFIQAAVTDTTHNISLTSKTSIITWNVQISTAPVTAQFFENLNNSGCVFTPRPGNPSLFNQTFPSLNFNPPGTNFGVFTDYVVGPQGMTTSTTILAQGTDAQGNLRTVGTDPINFFAYFTSKIIVSQPGDVRFNLSADDSFVFGLGPNTDDATKVPTLVSKDVPNDLSQTSTNPQNLSNTIFKAYPILRISEYATYAHPKWVVVHFPVAGTYPYEVDYTECYGGPRFALSANGSGLPPAASLNVSSPLVYNEGTNTTGPVVKNVGSSQTVTVVAKDAGGNPIPNQNLSLDITGANPTLQSIALSTGADGTAQYTYQGQNGGDDTLHVSGSIGSVLVTSNQWTLTWATPSSSQQNAPTVLSGWIASPTHHSTIGGSQIPVTLVSGKTLVAPSSGSHRFTRLVSHP